MAMERETMLSTYAEFLASGGVRPGAAAQVGYDPDVEAQKLAFEKQKWEDKLRREEAERQERRIEREDKLRREEAKLRKEEAEREDKLRREEVERERRERLRERKNYEKKRINCVKKRQNNVDGRLIKKRDRGKNWLKMRDDKRKCNNKLSYLRRDSVSLIARRPEIEPRRQDAIVPF